MARPTNWDICIRPRAKPRCSSGGSVATRVMAAETVPQKMPCAARSTSNWLGSVTKAMGRIKREPARVARPTINLRPKRSARAPQMGATAIMAKPSTLLSKATQRVVSA